METKTETLTSDELLAEFYAPKTAEDVIRFAQDVVPKVRKYWEARQKAHDLTLETWKKNGWDAENSTAFVVSVSDTAEVIAGHDDMGEELFDMAFRLAEVLVDLVKERDALAEQARWNRICADRGRHEWYAHPTKQGWSFCHQCGAEEENRIPLSGVAPPPAKVTPVTAQK